MKAAIGPLGTGLVSLARKAQTFKIGRCEISGALCPACYTHVAYITVDHYECGECEAALECDECERCWVAWIDAPGAVGSEP